MYIFVDITKGFYDANEGHKNIRQTNPFFVELFVHKCMFDTLRFCIIEKRLI